MVVAISAHQKLIWAVTSKQIRDNYSVFRPYMRFIDVQKFDFRRPKGPELACRCPGCKRMTPIATATIDHIIPRSNIRFEIVEDENWECEVSPFFLRGNKYEIKRNGMVSLLPYDTDLRPRRANYSVDADGQIMHCVHTDITIDIDIMTLLQNDLYNLQPMCAYCNSKKGNRS